MSKSNGQSVYDIVTSGWKRLVKESNNNGTLDVNIPNDAAEKYDIGKGDEVAIVESDTDDGVLELHFDSDE